MKKHIASFVCATAVTAITSVSPTLANWNYNKCKEALANDPSSCLILGGSNGVHAVGTAGDVSAVGIVGGGNGVSAIGTVDGASVVAAVGIGGGGTDDGGPGDPSFGDEVGA